MTIKIEAKPLEIKAELPGYGIFYLRRMGAGKAADVMDRLNKAKARIDEIAEKYKDIIEKEKQLAAENNEVELANLRVSEEYAEVKAAQQESQAELQGAISYSNKCQLELWRAEDPKAKERLLNDFTIDEIQGFYAQVMTEANKDA